MEYSKNRIVNQVLRYIGEYQLVEIESFINAVLERNFITFENEDKINSFFKEYLDKFYSNHNTRDIQNIRNYTGYNFSNINAVLRDNWNYNINGVLTKQKIDDIRKYTYNLGQIMDNLESLTYNVRTYRGTTLSSFKSYGVNSISDLEFLKGKYLYEEGFISTSLIRERSFFNRDLEYHEACNIEIEYLIPEEVNEVLPLINDDLSYSKSQSELLISKGSLSKVVDVVLSDDKKKAFIKVVLVPKKVYDRKLEQERNIK